MDAKVIWLFVFVALYWAYCIFWGVKGALTSKTASDYFIAGRGISIWVFVLAATATSFSGWTFMGHPGLLYKDGFPYAYASFYAITIPFTGVMFLKRQWMIGKRFGFVTPGEMFSDYFRSDVIRILIVIVALVFSVPYLGIQLRASGFLFNVLTDGMLGVDVGMWLLSAVVIIYVASGGLRAVAYVDTMQCLLLAGGIVAIGIIALSAVGGMDNMSRGIAALSQMDQNRTPAGYSHYVAIPGVIQFVDAGSQAKGGAWTGIMVLTYMFALMGIQSAPAFSMWSFSNKSPKPFAPQQVWASAFGIGLILFSFTAIQGIGGHFLGTNLQFFKEHRELTADTIEEVQSNIIRSKYQAALDPLQPIEIRQIVGTALEMYHASGIVPTFGDVAETGEAGSGAAESLIAFHQEQNQGLAGDELFDAAATPALVDLMSSAGAQGMLVPQLINLMADSAAWLVGLLSVCALAAMQSTGAAYMSTAGAMLTRDLLKHYLMPQANHQVQKLFGRIGVLVIVIAALIVATTSSDALVLLGGLAVAYGFQMWPALIAICWWPFLTGPGVMLGLVAGLAAVTLTESIGPSWFGIEAWGRWPLTIHSAGWGIFFNLGIAIIVSLFTQTREHREHRMTFHNFLREHASLSDRKRKLVPTAWIFTILWFIFAIGPGAVIGNTIFGNPNAPETWLFGIPSIWTWQIIWWVLGVFMMWFLAYKMEMSTVPTREVEALIDDIGDAQPAPQSTGPGR